MNIINPMKNLYIATIGEDFARWVKKTQSGLELDQFCMAENLDEPKYESCCKGIMDIHDLLQQAKELCKPQWMLDTADYATEMKCHRHPYQRGISARQGIEY